MATDGRELLTAAAITFILCLLWALLTSGCSYSVCTRWHLDLSLISPSIPPVETGVTTCRSLK